MYNFYKNSIFCYPVSSLYRFKHSVKSVWHRVKILNIYFCSSFTQHNLKLQSINGFKYRFSTETLIEGTCECKISHFVNTLIFDECQLHSRTRKKEINNLWVSYLFGEEIFSFFFYAVPRGCASSRRLLIHNDGSLAKAPLDSSHEPKFSLIVKNR